MGALSGQTSALEDLLTAFSSAVAEHQPELAVTSSSDLVFLEGRLVVKSADGPFDTFDVRVSVSPSFPFDEPSVFETGGRIPRVVDRHVFEESGACCLGVWEEWLILAPEHSPAAFLTGPLHDFFLSQCWYEVKGEWPFGDRSHGMLGILEAYCDILGIDQDLGKASAYLRLLSRRSIKGHITCPCGSGHRIRNCHREKLAALHVGIPPFMASRMLRKLTD